MRRKSTLLFGSMVLLIASSLFGCVSSVVLDTTREVGGHATALNMKLSEYQSALEADAAGRVERLANMQVRVESLSIKLDEKIAIWKLLKFDNSLRILNGVLAMRDKAITTRSELNAKYDRELAALKATQAKFRSQQKVLTDLAQQLNELADPTNQKALLEFFQEYAREVKEKLEDLEKESEASADASTPTT